MPQLSILLILFFLVYVWSKTYSRKDILQRFSLEERKKIYSEINKCDERALDKVRVRYPVGNKLIGQTIILEHDVDVKRSDNSTTKVLAGEKLKILGWSRDLKNYYIVQNQNIDKGYLCFDNPDTNQRIDKQLILQEELFEQCLKVLARTYNLSDEELLHFRKLYTLYTFKQYNETKR